MRTPFFIFLLAIGFLSACPVLASEKIDDYQVEIKINQGSSIIDVVEKIKYNFGDNSKHGIYRDIPLISDLGRIQVDHVNVQDKKGVPYKYKVVVDGTNLNIKVGDAHSYVTGIKDYIISYQVDGALDYYEQDDELYWDAIGTEWTVPITSSKVVVYLPKELAKDQISNSCYMGELGSKENCIQTNYISSGGLIKGVEFIGGQLPAGQGLTVSVAWPKNLVAQPSFLYSIFYYAKHLGIIYILVVFISMLVIWFRYGRDPIGRKIIVAQFDAPDNLSPAEVGTILDEKVDNKDVSATIIDLARRGYLKIKRIEVIRTLKVFDYELSLIKDDSNLEKEFEKKLIYAIFKDGDVIKLSDLRNEFYRDLRKIESEIYQFTTQAGYFSKNPKSIRFYFYTIASIFVFGSMFLPLIQVVLIDLIISGIIIFIFARFLVSRTLKGVLAREHILGLKKYLSVAEKDRLDFHNAPEKDPERFEALLPYAMVLGVEKQWAKQFSDIYKAEPDWYTHTGGQFSSIDLANSLNSFSSIAQSILSSSSGGRGSSGGGSSGGGGGGGGGGSW
ncbi:MAG: DUF2207 domain-containing protein [bacterium]